MTLSPKLGHFDLLEEIGRGGIGSVYRAFDPTLNREVAIKLVREDLASDSKFVTDFLRETRIAAGINHPHIVHIYFAGEDRGQYYIVMQLLKGRTLLEVVEAEGPLDEERVLDLAIEVGEALRAAYRGRLIHGDIKPANIFLTEEHGVKVLDFGLAKLANFGVSDEDGVEYFPHQVPTERVGQGVEDLRPDVHGLGATMYYALSGCLPFDSSKLEEPTLTRFNETPPLLRELRSDITPKTEEVVNELLEENTLLRYQNYDVLLEDLRDAKAEAMAKRLGISFQPESQTQDAGAVPTLIRRRRLVSFAVLVFAALAVMAAVICLR